MSSDNSDEFSHEDLREFVPDGARIMGRHATPVGMELKFTAAHAELLQKLLEMAKKEVESNPPGHGVQVGAVCPEIFDGGRRYVMQFSIHLVPVDAKSQAH